MARNRKGGETEPRGEFVYIRGDLREAAHVVPEDEKSHDSPPAGRRNPENWGSSSVLVPELQSPRAGEGGHPFSLFLFHSVLDGLSGAWPCG